VFYQRLQSFIRNIDQVQLHNTSSDNYVTESSRLGLGARAVMNQDKRQYTLDNYVIWPGRLALTNREPITLRNLLMRANLQQQKVRVT
jgi:hypothetical protein